MITAAEPPATSLLSYLPPLFRAILIIQSPTVLAHLVARDDRFRTASPLKKNKNGIGLITQAISASNKPAYWKPMLCCIETISGRLLDRKARSLTNIWVTQSGTEEATRLRMSVLAAMALWRNTSGNQYRTRDVQSNDLPRRVCDV